MQFCSPYDEAVAASGPPSIFLRTLEGVWRVQPDLSRDGCERLKRVPARQEGHGLMTDTATGFVTAVYTTGRSLFEDHPRVTVKWFASEAEAAAALDALGRPPVR